MAKSPQNLLANLSELAQDTLVSNLGIEYVRIEAELVEAIMPVNEKTRQYYGILHGGANLALAETLAGVGSMCSCEKHQYPVGIQVSANHVAAAKMGETVKGIATIIHKGNTTHVWNVDIYNQNTGQLTSTVRVTNFIKNR